jgi:hypothetical protein
MLRVFFSQLLHDRKVTHVSTTIYGGLIATDNNVFTVAKAIRELIEPVYYEKYAAHYDVIKASDLSVAAYLRENPRNNINGFINVEELITKAGISDDKIALYRVDSDLWNVMDALDKESTHTFSDADIFYHVSLMENLTGGNPLVMVFGTDNEEYTKILTDHGIVAEYGYWDNTDPEEGISDDEWEQRKKAWGVLIEGAGKSPHEVALGFDSPSRMSSALYVTHYRHQE